MAEIVSFESVKAEGDDAFVPNSSIALDRLRSYLARVVEEGGRQLAPERRLAAELGVGRGSLRRALDVLEAEGQIQRVQGSGTFVGRGPLLPGRLSDLSRRTNPLEVMETRLEIEPILARLAAERASEAEIDAMRRIARRVSAAVDSDSRELWDGALHRRIAEAARNRLLLDLYSIVESIRQDEGFRSLREAARSRVSLADAIAQHGHIIEAIGRRNGADAEAAMRQHLAMLIGQLRGVSAQPHAGYGGAGGAIPVSADAPQERLDSHGN